MLLTRNIAILKMLDEALHIKQKLNLVRLRSPDY